HGARATLRWVKRRTDGRSQWRQGVLERRGWNRTAVAVANKHARIVWALLSRGGVYGTNASSSSGQAPWRHREWGEEGPARVRSNDCNRQKAHSPGFSGRPMSLRG